MAHFYEIQVQHPDYWKQHHQDHEHKDKQDEVHLQDHEHKDKQDEVHHQGQDHKHSLIIESFHIFKVTQQQHQVGFQKVCQDDYEVDFKLSWNCRKIFSGHFL